MEMRRPSDILLNKGFVLSVLGLLALRDTYF